jgi:hypothetical protein
MLRPFSDRGFSRISQAKPEKFGRKGGTTRTPLDPPGLVEHPNQATNYRFNRVEKRRNEKKKTTSCVDIFRNGPFLINWRHPVPKIIQKIIKFHVNDAPTRNFSRKTNNSLFLTANGRRRPPGILFPIGR